MEKNKYTTRTVLAILGGLPFVFAHARWAPTALVVYTLTVVLFGILLSGEYPPFASRWFWKSMTPIVLIHALLAIGTAMVTIAYPSANALPRVLYGFVGLLLVGEWKLCLLIINALEPKNI